jgi:diguanylate cyclase (GGDEF)-like protein/PAS domain S-box-containing protein
MDKVLRDGAEFESLWDKLEDLKRLESDLANSRDSGPVRTPEQIKNEITARLGYFPPYFGPALDSLPLLESLWRHQLSSYFDNPLPQLFKEKLALYLSRCCTSSYFTIVHACRLYQLGMTPQEIIKIFEKPPLDSKDIEQTSEILARFPHPISLWPEEEVLFDESLMDACLLVFLGSESSGRFTVELKEILGSENYGYLTALLACIKAAHSWVESHPEISHEGHSLVINNYQMLIQTEPKLEEIFRNHRYPRDCYFSKFDKGERTPENDDRYRELFENASDIIYIHNFEGKILSVNRAVEKIAGYTRAEVMQMNIMDAITPEYHQIGEKMIDPQVAGEIPLNCEVEIFSKEKARIALGISTRPIFRGGKAVAVQGIARDITKRKQTEVELHEANQKLEAWVNELEQRTREMTLLNDMGDILRACFTTEEAYNVIVRVAQQIFPVQVGALYVIAPSRNMVEAAAVWGDAALVERTFTPHECWALRRGRTHWVENSRLGLICRHIHHTPSDGYMCIPMMAQSEALGVLHLMQPDKVKMTETKQRMAITMSEHIAMALSNLRLHETLRSQSIRDPLTGLFNRRFMEESLELELRRASRNQRPLGMIMMDLDHFKYFNDNFGHEAGDLLLKELGTLLKGNIRGEDIACRYGGEEFTLILPEGTGVVTRQRAEFFKEAIQRLDVQFHGRPLGKITASMGVAVFPDHGRTAKALIDAADKALYRSKSAGRDCVTLAG